ETTPSQARVELVGAGVTWRRYHVEAPAPTTLTFDLFFHPSLSIRSDGQRLAARPTGDDGLATVDLPPGTHELALEPEWSRTEVAAAAVSAAAPLAALAPLAVPGVGRRGRAAAAAALVAAVSLSAACHTPSTSPASVDAVRPDGPGDAVPSIGESQLVRPAGEARLGDRAVVL